MFTESEIESGIRTEAPDRGSGPRPKKKRRILSLEDQPTRHHTNNKNRIKSSKHLPTVQKRTD